MMQLFFVAANIQAALSVHPPPRRGKAKGNGRLPNGAPFRAAALRLAGALPVILVVRHDLRHRAVRLCKPSVLFFYLLLRAEENIKQSHGRLLSSNRHCNAFRFHCSISEKKMSIKKDEKISPAHLSRQSRVYHPHTVRHIIKLKYFSPRRKATLLLHYSLLPITSKNPAGLVKSEN